MIIVGIAAVAEPLGGASVGPLPPPLISGDGACAGGQVDASVMLTNGSNSDAGHALVESVSKTV